MSRTIKYLGLTVLILMIAALGVSSAFAQTPTPPATTTTPQAHGGGFGRGGTMCGQTGLDAAAKALKMTTDELTAQLWGGQTLSGLAEKAGVDIATVQSAVQAACQQAQIDAINQAVTDGKLTRENADWLIEGIQKGYIGGGKAGFGGFGMEMGGRGHHGFGGFGKGTVPNGTTPNTTPNSGSTAPSRYTF